MFSNLFHNRPNSHNNNSKHSTLVSDDTIDVSDNDTTTTTSRFHHNFHSAFKPTHAFSSPTLLYDNNTTRPRRVSVKTKHRDDKLSKRGMSILYSEQHRHTTQNNIQDKRDQNIKTHSSPSPPGTSSHSAFSKYNAFQKDHHKVKRKLFQKDINKRTRENEKKRLTLEIEHLNKHNRKAILRCPDENIVTPDTLYQSLSTLRVSETFWWLIPFDPRPETRDFESVIEDLTRMNFGIFGNIGFCVKREHVACQDNNNNNNSVTPTTYRKIDTKSGKPLLTHPFDYGLNTNRYDKEDRIYLLVETIVPGSSLNFTTERECYRPTIHNEEMNTILTMVDNHDNTSVFMIPKTPQVFRNDVLRRMQNKTSEYLYHSRVSPTIIRSREIEAEKRIIWAVSHLLSTWDYRQSSNNTHIPDNTIYTGVKTTSQSHQWSNDTNMQRFTTQFYFNKTHTLPSFLKCHLRSSNTSNDNETFDTTSGIERLSTTNDSSDTLRYMINTKTRFLSSWGFFPNCITHQHMDNRYNLQSFAFKDMTMYDIALSFPITQDINDTLVSKPHNEETIIIEQPKHTLSKTRQVPTTNVHLNSMYQEEEEEEIVTECDDKQDDTLSLLYYTKPRHVYHAIKSIFS